jgi:hypothetical protein
LVTELEKPAPGLGGILGLSYRQGQEWVHNPNRPLLELDTLSLPRRQARLANGFYFLEMPMDVAETSRGCPNNCKFCSITQMYGHTFRRFSVERIISDLKAIRDQGFKAVFFVDDNITYDIDHFRQVCQAIVQHQLNDLCYLTQVSAAGIAQHPELVADMDRANFRITFVGFESMDPDALKGMKKPTNPELNRRAAALLRQHRIAIIAGLISGYPEDTRETVIRNWRMIEDLKPDLIYSQYLTPYPKTPVRQELLEAGLVVDVDDGVWDQDSGHRGRVELRVLEAPVAEELLDLPGQTRIDKPILPISAEVKSGFIKPHDAERRAHRHGDLERFLAPARGLDDQPIVHLRVVAGVETPRGHRDPLAPGERVEGRAGKPQPAFIKQRHVGAGIGRGYRRAAARAARADDEDIAVEDGVIRGHIRLA